MLVKKLGYCIIALVIALLIVGCSTSDDAPQIDTVLRVSVLPDRQPALLRAQFEPLIEYLAAQTTLKFELILFEDYQQLLEGFHQKQLDLVLFGGFTYAKAHVEDNAQALVMRDIDSRFVSYFLVRADDNAKNLADLKGRRFSFGSDLSTSGHLMPRFFLNSKNIIAEDFFSEVRYSGAHDLTAQWVQQGKVDVGVANSLIIDRLYRQGIISKDQIRILWETPPYSDYTWAIQGTLPERFKNKILDAFLKLSYDNSEHRKILDAVGAKTYFPSNVDDFNFIENIARQLNLIKEN